MDTATTRAIHNKYVWLIRRKPSEVFLRLWYQSNLGRRSDGGPRARIVETIRIGLSRRNGEIRRDNKHIRSPSAWLKWLNKSILGRVGENAAFWPKVVLGQWRWIRFGEYIFSLALQCSLLCSPGGLTVVFTSGSSSPRSL